jgi:transglutaminase-like putative cysteine protease
MCEQDQRLLEKGVEYTLAVSRTIGTDSPAKKGGFMNRRDFLRSAGAVSASLAFSDPRILFAKDAPSGTWRTFDVTTRVEVLKSAGKTRVWVPAALSRETPFQKTFANTFDVEGGTAKMIENKPDSLGIIAAEFPAGVKPVVTVTSRVATRNHGVDLSAVSSPGASQKESRAELAHFLRPTKLIPTDGIVRETAAEITKGATTDLGKARAIYEWIVDNTFRNPKTRGCGVGDIRFMLESRRFAIRKRAAAASVIFASCSNRAILAANAPISTPSI